MRIKFNGQIFNVDRGIIEKKMKGAEPAVGRRFFVAVNGMKFPIKQVFSLAIGQPTAAFPTSYAFNVLARLGFEIIDANVVKVDG